MKWALLFFLSGFLSALIILGFNTPILPKFQIVYPIPSSWPEFLIALGTILTAIVALALGLWGKTLGQIFYRSNILLIGHHENIQTYRDGRQEGHTRLKFLNDGRSIAQDVMVYIDELTEDGSPRPNFLPVPLSWTHDGNYKRDFAPHEIWYLDLCRKDNIADNEIPILVLAAGQGVIEYDNLNEGETILRINVSHESGQFSIYRVFLYWQSGSNFVQVIDLNEIT